MDQIQRKTIYKEGFYTTETIQLFLRADTERQIQGKSWNGTHIVVFSMLKKSLAMSINIWLNFFSEL